MDPLIITVFPAGKGKFIAKLDERQLCQRTFTPFFAAARVLAAEGRDHATKIIMRYEGSDTDCLTSTIGIAALITVRETQLVAPRLVPFRGVEESEVDDGPPTE